MHTDKAMLLILAVNALAGLLAVCICLCFAQLEDYGAFAGALATGLVLCTAFISYSKILKPMIAERKQARELAEQAILTQSAAASTSESRIESLAKTNTSLSDLDLIQRLVSLCSSQLTESRKKEKSIIENAADVICVIDVECKILQVNNAALSVWGYKPNELIGHKLTEFLHSEDSSNTFESILGAEQSIKQIFFENRFKKKNGKLADLLWSAHWSASDGGLFCVVHDITERKYAERILQENEERVRTILENLPAGVALVAESGSIKFMNQTAYQLTGFEKMEDLAELRASHLFGFCKEPFSFEHLDAKIEQNTSKRDAADSLVNRKDGSKLPAEISISRLRIAERSNFLIIFLDQTAKHEIERAKRELIAIVGHEIRAPLTSITLILGAIEEGVDVELPQRERQWISRARNESSRLIRLVSELLDMEKMEAGKFQLILAETKIDELLESSIQVLEKSAESRSVQISTEGLKGVVCHCDGARIIQVLVNLIDNAIKFTTPDTTVQVAVECDDDSFARISVRNKGRRIPEEKLAVVFEKFEQVAAADQTERKGTGLGLSICKTIVEQHGGKIWARSNSEATTFGFSLPLRSRKSGARFEAAENDFC